MPITSGCSVAAVAGLTGGTTIGPPLRPSIRQSKSSDERTGFVRLPAKPRRCDSAAPSRSPDELSRKRAIVEVDGSDFNTLASSIPSIPGMFRSSTPTSKVWPASAAVAASWIAS